MEQVTGRLFELELEKNRLQKYRAADEALQKIKSSGIDFTVKADLTFPFDPKDIEHAEKKFRKFMNKLNQRVLGNRFKRKEERIKLVAMIEGEISKKRLHYHCMFELPAGYTLSQFKDEIDYYWAKTNGNYRAEIKVEEIYSFEWAEYITKELVGKNTDVFSDSTYYG